jgi:hypothetical protein
MSFKDQTKRRRAAEKRGRRGARRASAMALKQAVLHPVVIGVDLGSGQDMCVAAYLDEAGTIQIVPDFD